MEGGLRFSLALSVGILKENFPSERRVAMAPRVIDLLKKSQVEVWIESGAGIESGFPDADYSARGATVTSADEIRKNIRIMLHVRVPEQPDVKPDDIVIGLCDPLSDPALVARYAQARATLFSLEFVPRITRAQSM